MIYFFKKPFCFRLLFGFAKSFIFNASINYTIISNNSLQYTNILILTGLNKLKQHIIWIQKHILTHIQNTYDFAFTIIITRTFIIIKKLTKIDINEENNNNKQTTIICNHKL